MAKLKNDRHTQAKKAERQSLKHKKHNKQIKNKIKKVLKSLNTAIESDNMEEAKKLLAAATKTLQSSINKNILHTNTASRKISKLTKKVNKIKAG